MLTDYVQVPPRQSEPHSHVAPSHWQSEEVQPDSMHVCPAGQPVTTQPVGLGPQPATSQVFPKQQLESLAGHQSQQKFPA